MLPIYTDEAGNSNLWGPTNLWLAPWSLKAPNVSLVPMVLPTGDVSDTDGLVGDPGAGRRPAAPDRAGAALRRGRRAGDGSARLAARRRRQAEFRDHRHALQPRSAAAASPTASRAIRRPSTSLLAQSADRTIAWVQSQWKQANLVDASKQSTMTVEVPIATLKQWVDIKKQLGGVPSLKSVRMVSLTRSLAILDISFLGDVPQFQRSLAQQDLSLATALGDPSKGTLRQDPNASVSGSRRRRRRCPRQMNQPAVPGSDAGGAERSPPCRNRRRMTLGTQAKVWGIALVVFVALLVLLKSILLPFVAGMAIAYLLDPVCDRLETMGRSRTLATIDRHGDLRDRRDPAPAADRPARDPADRRLPEQPAGLHRAHPRPAAAVLDATCSSASICRTRSELSEIARNASARR